MKVTLFTMHLDPETGSFDDAALAELSGTKDILSMSDHFFVHEGMPVLAVLVGYRERTTARTVRRPGPGKPVELDKADRAVYERLRKWRNDRAKREGRPAYAAFSNDQLAEIARRRPTTKEALAAIEGVGVARIRNYADDVLSIVNPPDSRAG